MDIIIKYFKAFFFGRKFIDILFDLSILSVSASLVLPIKINSICIILSLVFWIFSGEFKYIGNLLKSKLVIALYIFYGLHILSIFYSTDIKFALVEVFEKKISYLFLPLLFINYDRIHRIKNLIIFSFSSFLTGAIIICYFNSFIDWKNSSTDEEIMNFFVYHIFSNHIGFQPIYLSLFTILSFFFILRFLLIDDKFSWIKKKGLLYNGVILLILLVHYISIVILSSRTEIMVFILLLTIFFTCYGYINKKMIYGVIFIFSLFLSSLLIIMMNGRNTERFKEMIDFRSHYTENRWGGRSLRIQKWKYSFTLWSQNKIFGVGIGDYQNRLNSVYKQNSFVLGVESKFNSHNQFIQTLVTLGIPGIFSLFYIFYSIFYAFVGTRDWTYWMFSLIFIFSMTTESILERNKGLISFVYFSLLISPQKKLTS